MIDDDTLAPGHDPSLAGLPWWTRAWRQGAGYFVPNLFFLLIPILFAWGSLPTWRFALLIAAAVATALIVVGTTIAVEWREGWRWAWLGLLIAMVAVIAALTDDINNLAYFNAYFACAAALLVPWRSARITMLATTLIGVGVALTSQMLLAGVLAFMGLVVGHGVGAGIHEAATAQALREAEERTAVLAVAAERERIGRDLHDILGHSLTAIAIKADLAARLVGRDDDAARREVGELASVARQALADVRVTASGLREVRLASEFAAARSVLKAAGIQVVAPSALPSVPDDESELMGYVLREAVTNVLRHSGASTCRIVVREGLVEVSDDGSGLPVSASRSGLRGLQERAAAAGWSLVVESNGGVTVRASRGSETMDA